MVTQVQVNSLWKNIVQNKENNSQYLKENLINYSDLIASITGAHGTVKTFLDKVEASKKRYDDTDQYSVTFMSSSLSLNAGVFYVNDGFSIDQKINDYEERLKDGLKIYVSYLKVRKAYNRNKDIAGLYKSVKDLQSKLTVDNIMKVLHNNNEFSIFSDYYKVNIVKKKIESIIEVDGQKIDFAK